MVSDSGTIVFQSADIKAYLLLMGSMIEFMRKECLSKRERFWLQLYFLPAITCCSVYLLRNADRVSKSIMFFSVHAKLNVGQHHFIMICSHTRSLARLIMRELSLRNTERTQQSRPQQSRPRTFFGKRQRVDDGQHGRRQQPKGLHYH